MDEGLEKEVTEHRAAVLVATSKVRAATAVTSTQFGKTDERKEQ